MKKWKAILGVVLVFVLGMLAGGLVTARVIQCRAQHIAAGGPRAVEELIVRRLSWRLNLDAGQREQLRTIIRDGQAEMRPVRQEMAGVFERAETKVRAILKPEQQEKFDKLVAQGKARWGNAGSL